MQQRDVRAVWALKRVRRLLLGQRRAVFTEPVFPARSPELKKPLLLVCGPSFNQKILNAETFMRVGFARGWAEVCGPARLVAVDRLMAEIDHYDAPAVFIGCYEMDRLSYAEARRLRHVDLFVWVSPHPRMHHRYEELILGASESDDGEIWLRSYGKIVMAEPKFVWNAIGRAGLEWYQGWLDDGFVWQTIYPGVDMSRYYPDPAPERFGHIRMAYVGGYWPEKAQGFDQYLRPWEDILVPFGYSAWPYRHYGGQLTEDEERQLYSSAGLIPLVHGPYGWLNAEITERYLKAPACRAFSIADHNPAFREVFSPEEVIQAEGPQHFHQLVREFLSGKIDVESWAAKGYEATVGRHSYAHRARQIRSALESASAAQRTMEHSVVDPTLGGT